MVHCKLRCLHWSCLQKTLRSMRKIWLKVSKAFYRTSCMILSFTGISVSLARLWSSFVGPSNESFQGTQICTCCSPAKLKKRGCGENSEILALLFMCRASLSPSAALFSALPLQRGPRSAGLRLSALILQHSPTSFSWPCRFTMMLVSSSPLWFCSTPKHTLCAAIPLINSASGSGSKAGIYWACPITWRGTTGGLIGSVVHVGWSVCTSTGVFSPMTGVLGVKMILPYWLTCCVSICGMLDFCLGMVQGRLYTYRIYTLFFHLLAVEGCWTQTYVHFWLHTQAAEISLHPSVHLCHYLSLHCVHLASLKTHFLLQKIFMHLQVCSMLSRAQKSWYLHESTLMSHACIKGWPMR